MNLLAFNQFFTFYKDFDIINHPVHIITKDNQTSPSAFIPFCDFGGDLSLMAIQTDQFEVPVCNSFQAKVLNDQLCYEIDPNEFNELKSSDNAMKKGLSFLVDFNEDRQVSYEKETAKKEDNLYGKFSRTINNEELMIYLDTIGKKMS